MAMASMSSSMEQTPTSLYNTRSTCMCHIVSIILLDLMSCLAVKRLMREAVEMKNPTELYYCQPIEVRFHSSNNTRMIFVDLLG